MGIDERIAGRGNHHMARIEIKELKNIDECRQCERIQALTWGATGVTCEAMYAVAKYGGVLIGTLINGKVVGFIFAFLAQYHGKLAHWSHMMAVEAKYRDQGFGYRMKLMHRKVAIERGIKSICWTFDPLQSRNARLNISRLGAMPEEYVPDCYGRFPSVLEKGLPSDRFVAHWKVSSFKLRQRLKGVTPKFNSELPRANPTILTPQGFLKNQSLRLNLKDKRLLVEIPKETETMRAAALELALKWRLETRRIFVHYLKGGYHVEDFFSPNTAADGRCYYLLQR